MPRRKLPTRVRRSKCATCVFRAPEEGGIDLAPGRREQIALMVLQGTSQLCHHDDNQSVCRGGRDYQLQCWHRMGLIAAPTDAALRRAMREQGVEPGKHV